MAARKTSYFTLALFLFLLMIIAQLSGGVHCRALRELKKSTISEDSSTVPVFGVSSKKNAQRSVKDMAFIMVSGPSRKGPGH
ncbi:hypothetical protein A4A49_23089 [Nicotiana attenuata]|uniref:Uncharacterized protein n=1 Tax=Nicotiana attenuata TaxID=49451 RepID=A0A314KYZ3_NICAT|nr:hypothetical protein A4A49_23089 [Nicotiana attenuata]